METQRETSVAHLGPAARLACIVLALAVTLTLAAHYAHAPTAPPQTHTKTSSETPPPHVSMPQPAETADEPAPDKPAQTAPADGPVAYLTFDDGPSLNTPDILDMLARHGVPATFFVCGNVTQFGRAIYNRILAEGHMIGNHTFSHDTSRIYSSSEAFLADFFKLQDLIAKTTGFATRILRFPGGSNSGHARRDVMLDIIQKLRELGYQYFDWNVSARDAEELYQDRDAIINSVLEGARGKSRAIILLHDSRTRMSTVEALPAIIEGLIGMGFTFRALNHESYPVQFIR